MYHFRDNIKNLKVTVELKLQSSIFDDDNTGNSHNDDNYDNNIEVCEINWQEKLFSRIEEFFYSDETNCNSPLSKLYHKQIVNIRKQGARSNARIFTYTNSDPVQFKFVTEFNIFTTENLNIRNIPTKRRILLEEPSIDFNDELLNTMPVKYVSLSLLSEPLKLQKSKPEFYLMADLSASLDNNDTKCENDLKLICKLAMISDEVLLVEPDFNSTDVWYKIENSIGQVWEYRITHTSSVSAGYDIVKERQLFNFDPPIAPNKLKQMMNSLKEPPIINLPPGEALFHISGEIVSCQYFAYNELYVKFKISLTDEYRFADTDMTSLDFTTQLCNSRWRLTDIFTRNYRQINFCYLFEFSLIGSNFATSSPQILFEVNSSDYWGRHSTLGYGSLNLRLNSKQCQVETFIDTWKISPENILGDLRSYFLGVTPRLDDLEVIRLGSEVIPNKLSKLGLKTSTSGRILLRHNFVKVQAHIPKTRDQTEGGIRVQFDDKMNTLKSSAMAIAAFQSLRKRIKMNKNQI